MSEIKKLLKQLLGDELGKIHTLSATVSAVDRDKKTCDVLPDDGKPEIYDVRLCATIDDENNPDKQGVFIYPAIRSHVLITEIWGNEVDKFVSLYSEVDGIEIIFNGFKITIDADGAVFDDGSNGGLAIVPELKKQLDKTNAVVNAIADTLKTWTPAAGDGGAALKLAIGTALTDKSTGDFSNIENTKIKH